MEDVSGLKESIPNIYFLVKNQQKQYIYIVYILYTHNFCKKGKVSCGYPMGMVWVSYGAGSFQYRCGTDAPPMEDGYRKEPHFRTALDRYSDDGLFYLCTGKGVGLVTTVD